MNILLEKDQAVYVAIEKVACSSIKYALGQHLGIARKGWPHNWPFPEIPLMEAWNRQLFVFAFVRNPFDRLVSCWAHKVARYAGRRPYCPLWKSLPTTTTFPEFVAWATAQNPQRCNWHFRPQWTWLYAGADRPNGAPLCDAIYRFEGLSLAWGSLQERFGWPDLPHRNQTDHPPYADLYTPAARQQAEQFYGRDLALFGYDF